MGPVQSLSELRHFLRRRAGLILLFLGFGVLLGSVMAAKTERLYSATAVIQVINPMIGTAEGEGALSISRRVQIIEQQLMSRENLLDLADRFDLFADVPLTATERMVLMRQSISIQNVAAAQTSFGRDGGLAALIITASARQPETTAAIANELANRLLTDSTSARQERASQTLRFFLQEEARLEDEINLLGDRISAFQTENEELLPAALALRREELGRLEESQLGVARELLQLRGELSSLEAESTRRVIQRRVAQLTDEIERSESESRLISGRIETIHALLSQAPEVEREMNAMARRLTQLQTQLATTAERRREAEIGQRIEDDQQAERFELLEAALVPDYPVSRSRRTVALAGVMLGLMLGLGLAYLREVLHPVLRSARQMERELDLRPVISIPFLQSDHERQRRRRIWMAGLGGMGLLALLLVALFLAGI